MKCWRSLLEQRQGFVSGNRSRLYLYDGETGSLEALTGEKLFVDSVELNADKTKAVLIGTEYTGMMPLTNSLYVADLQSKEVTRLTPGEDFAYASAHFITDQELICRGGSRERYGLNENARFYLVRFDGSRELLTPDFDRSAYSSVGSDCRYGGGRGMCLDGGFLYFVTTEGESSYLNRIDKTGRIEKISREPGSVDSFSVKDGRILLVALRELSFRALQPGRRRRKAAHQL